MNVLFLHGFASDSSVWQGYSITNVENRFYDIRFDENDVPILPQITEKTVLVSWSMGCMVALEILKKYPTKISALFLLSGSPEFMKSTLFPEGKTAKELFNFKEMFFDEKGRGILKFQQQLFSREEIREGWLKKFRKEIAGKIKLEKNTLLSSIKFLEHYRAENIPQNLEKVFVFHGNRDMVVDVNAIKSWKKIFSNAKITVLNASHSLPFVKKKFIQFEIQRFCDEN